MTNPRKASAEEVLPQGNLKAGLQLAGKSVVDLVCSRVKGHEQLKPRMEFSTQRNGKIVRAVLIVKDDLMLTAEQFPRAMLDSPVGREAVAKTFVIPLQQAAILWAFGYSDGLAGVKQSNVEPPKETAVEAQEEGTVDDGGRDPERVQAPEPEARASAPPADEPT